MSHKSTNASTHTPSRWLTHILLILFFQCIFYGSVAVSVYALVTLNWKLILVLLAITLIQRVFKKNETIINLVVKYVRPTQYFKNFKKVYEEQISQNQAALFCLHPHSVLSYCLPANMHADNDKMSQMTGLASRFLLNMPVIGAQLRIWGIEAVNAHNIKKLMEMRKPIGLLPGGFQQASLTTPKQLRVFIKERKGFIKYALTHNYTIYPVLTFNEHKAFSTLDIFTNFRLMLTKLKIPTVLFGNGFLWLFLPLNIDITTVIGKGIRRDQKKVKQNLAVQKQEIDEVHQKYIKQMERIHGKFRDEHGDVKLAIY